MLSYDLPKELIAQRPCEPRDQARLLVLDRQTGATSHQVFQDLIRFLNPGDCLVLNDTEVLPARLFGTKADTAAKVELLLLASYPDSLAGGEKGLVYRCLGQPGKRLKPGAKLIFDHGSLRGEVLGAEGAERLVRFTGSDPLGSDPFRFGQVPLPPYIRRSLEPQDAQWYQTVYARHPGAVAAPTAGLHFTSGLLDRIRAQGVRVAFVTLHVGWGTFKPVGEEELREGRLHAEPFRIPPQTEKAIGQTKAAGGRVVAVGTTVVRALETMAIKWGQTPFSLTGSDPKGSDPFRTTDLFIRPGFEFQVVDAMITNFHLPGTSLLYLVAAFVGEEKILEVYQEAIRQQYRFYSYGDAMLIL